jgi:2-dehydro-3-deoxyphosphogluconate aldolase/(4S)-4-hydroxy-2-oxoglutarate aldolase
MNLPHALRNHRLLAILRGPDPDAALAALLALADAGVALIEVSLTGADALATIRRAWAALGADFALGAGTVLTVEDVQRATDAGAGFLVTPAIAPSLAEAARLGVPVLAGALTPSEVVAASTGGASESSCSRRRWVARPTSAHCAIRSRTSTSYPSAA